MRRREMLEFAVLGLLHESPLHGYELRRRLNTRLGAFRALSFGTLYPCLASLQGQELVSVDRDEPRGAGSRRQRITYTITDAGREAFAAIAGRTDPSSWADDAFDVRLAFFARTEREVRLRILEGRRARLAEQLGAMRAAEQGAHWGHTRPDGSELWSAKVNGQQTWAESLAAGASLERSILDSWGHGELAALNNNRGAYASGAGHLHMMINPKNRYYGFGAVYIPRTENGTYTAATTSETRGNSTPMEAGMQRAWLYRPAAPGENPTGIKQGTPGPVKQVPGDAAGPAGSSEDLNTIIGIVIGILGLIGAVAAIAQQLGLI